MMCTKQYPFVLDVCGEDSNCPSVRAAVLEYYESQKDQTHRAGKLAGVEITNSNLWVSPETAACFNLLLLGHLFAAAEL